MRIVCTKDEFAKLVRECSISSREEQCCGCVFAPVCSQAQDITDDYEIMSCIEDICEIESISSFRATIENYMKLGGSPNTEIRPRGEDDG